MPGIIYLINDSTTLYQILKMSLLIPTPQAYQFLTYSQPQPPISRSHLHRKKGRRTHTHTHGSCVSKVRATYQPPLPSPNLSYLSYRTYLTIKPTPPHITYPILPSSQSPFPPLPFPQPNKPNPNTARKSQPQPKNPSAKEKGPNKNKYNILHTARRTGKRTRNEELDWVERTEVFFLV